MRRSTAIRCSAILLCATALTPAGGSAQTLTFSTLTGDYVSDENSFLWLGNSGVGTGVAVGNGQTSSYFTLSGGLILGRLGTGDGTASLSNLGLGVGGGTSQYVFVGEQGRGDLTLSGANLFVFGTSQDATEPYSPFLGIGKQAGSDGTVRVQSGSLVTITNGVTQVPAASVGSGIQIGGTRTIDGGTGRLIVDGGYVFVTGTNLSYVNVGRRGAAASGTLSLVNGGAMVIGSTITPESYLNVGRGGASGLVTVSGRSATGTNSRIQIDGTTTSVLEVGGDTAGSVGRLSITDGGLVDVRVAPGASGKTARVNVGSDGASGTVTVEGAFSVLELYALQQSGSADTILSVGQSAGGTGGLTVAGQGTTTVGLVNTQTNLGTVRSRTYIGEAAGSNGTVTVSGSGSRLATAGNISGVLNSVSVGHQGTGSLTVGNGGAVDVVTGNGAAGAIVVGARASGVGTLQASGTGTRVNAADFFGIGAAPGDDHFASIRAGGSANILDGGVGTATFTDGATLTATTVQLSTPNNPVIGDRILSFTNRARIQAQEAVIFPQGIFSGNGVMTGRVALRGGRLSTGSTVGTMSIGGGLQVTSGTMEVKVAGRTAGQYDVYAVTGAAEFSGGTVLVVFADSFQPAGGDRYTVVTATSGARGSETVTARSNRDGVTVQFVPAAQTGALDVLVVGAAPSAEADAEETVAATAEEQTRSVVRAVVTSVSARIREIAARRSAAVRTSGFMTGLAAGDGTGGPAASGVSAWVDGGVSRLLNDTPGSKFAGYSRNLLVGTDVTFGDFVVGGLVALERSTLSLSDTEGDRSSKGASLVGYVGYLFDEIFSGDLQVGAGRLSNTLRETRGGRTDSGDFTSNRLFVASNLNATWASGDLTVVGTVGASFSRERFDSYATDSGSRIDADAVYLGQVRLGAEVSYALGNVAPYLSAAYEVDVRSSEDGDRNGAVLGAGLRAPVSANLTAGVFGAAQILRENDRNYTLGANLRYTF